LGPSSARNDTAGLERISFDRVIRRKQVIESNQAHDYNLPNRNRKFGERTIDHSQSFEQALNRVA